MDNVHMLCNVTLCCCFTLQYAELSIFCVSSYFLEYMGSFSVVPMYRASRADSKRGIAIAVGIIICWWSALIYLLTLPIVGFTWGMIPAYCIMTLLYTGLFITAHDAMHGSVARHYRRLNMLIGIVCVSLYAVFSYRKLWTKHWDHHRFVATEHDPDYHNGSEKHLLAWYGHFLKNYISVWQIVAMAIIFNGLHHVLHIPIENLLIFWVAPAITSTFQLFYFGTYLPHREPEDGYTNRHRSNSNDFPLWLSFLTCYHFGYHWEHHEFPAVPWWRLPAVRRLMREES
jgi:beta-carotene ketolase (CrtW type)